MYTRSRRWLPWCLLFIARSSPEGIPQKGLCPKGTSDDCKLFFAPPTTAFFCCMACNSVAKHSAVKPRTLGHETFYLHFILHGCMKTSGLWFGSKPSFLGCSLFSDLHLVAGKCSPIPGVQRYCQHSSPSPRH